MEEIVRQGTIYGPILCGVTTDKVNSCNKKVITYYNTETELETMTYVDDICGVGSKENVEQIIDNCIELEMKKKMTFSTEKSQYMIMKFGKKEPELINKNVAKGEIEATPLYKYLGDYITEDGKNQFMMEKRKEKINYMISTRIKYGEMAGELYFQVIIEILETVIIPTLINNAETWTNITNKEIDEIENMQKTILQRIFKIKRNTPYWGI